jgi:hypothetical protein
VHCSVVFFVWGPTGLLSGGPVLLGRVGVAFIERIPSVLILFCHILLDLLGGMDGNLQFQVPSMNRLNQTEPVTFSILSCWALFWDSVYLLYLEVICN